MHHSVDVGAPVHVTEVVLGAVDARTNRLGSVVSVNQLLEPVVVNDVIAAGTLAATQTEMFPEAPVRVSDSAPVVAKLVPGRTNAVVAEVVTPPLKDILSIAAGALLVHVAVRVLAPAVGFTNPNRPITRLVLVLWMLVINVRA
jgi:hypothetical protein